ncbi:hypothetical protein AB5J62_28905 [Amycolatopsis sp. cg5]|uniref:hypothetical protein n=1 Tax=Amycolatopsis sp. cg5 TaxID=3238802 RepID=UPI00352522C8
MKNAMIEVKIVVGLFLGIALAWTLLIAFEVLFVDARPLSFLVPVASLILGGLVVAGMALRMPSSRIAGFVVAGLFGLLHALFMLGAQLWWVKVFSGLAFAGYMYAAVLLNSMPVRRFVLGAKA